MKNLKSDFFINIIHMQKWRVTSVYVAILRLDQEYEFGLSFHFLSTTFDLIAIKANGQWLVLLFFNYHLCIPKYMLHVGTVKHMYLRWGKNEQKNIHVYYVIVYFHIFWALTIYCWWVCANKVLTFISFPKHYLWSNSNKSKRTMISSFIF
jgi:hypothetical protein